MTDVGALPWGTSWQLVRAEKAGSGLPTFHVTLSLQGGRAGGRTPVNRYFGGLTETGPGQLALGPFGMTMMAGSPEAMAAEQAYLLLLERVRGYRASVDELVLLDEGDRELLAFEPEPDPV